jgi:hypothetical protein
VSERVGAALVALSPVAVAVAYPPPALGVGSWGLFLPLAVAATALLAATAGGALLGRAVARTRLGTGERLVARALGPLVAVAPLVAYLAVVAGLDGAVLAVGPLAFAAVVGGASAVVG